MTSVPTARHSIPGAHSLVDVLLSQEREWTAVEQFATWHRQEEAPSRNRQQLYQRLMPLAQPKKGEQFAFEVDLDKCSGCKACVVACHSLNGLDETETWRSVGLLVGPPAVQQHVTTACHHCVDPACLNGCPVLAYDKDPLTGVVRHLDDQCIGCQYCIMKCPYEVPQYSKRLGIVRKCDMCYHRLSAGEAPACAQACPSEAIRITIVDQATVATEFKKTDRAIGAAAPHTSSRTSHVAGFLPDSPDPALTLPVTRYLSSNVLPSNLRAADHRSLRIEQGHWPLVAMLVFSQAAAGLFLASLVLKISKVSVSLLPGTALLLLGVGCPAAGLHLGRPLRAWRAFLGWRASWLSRELIALNCFAALAAFDAWFTGPSGGGGAVIASTALVGLLAVFTSAMVYVDTGRPAWNGRLTFINFYSTTLLLGTGLAAALLAWKHEHRALMPFIAAAFATRLAVFVWRELEQRAALRNVNHPVYLNALVARDLLSVASKADALLLVMFAVCVLLAFGDPGGHRAALVTLAAVTLLLSELVSRYVFFAASARRRMPGGVHT